MDAPGISIGNIWLQSKWRPGTVPNSARALRRRSPLNFQWRTAPRPRTVPEPGEARIFPGAVQRNSAASSKAAVPPSAPAPTCELPLAGKVSEAKCGGHCRGGRNAQCLMWKSTGVSVSKSKGFSLKSRVFALLGAKALDFGAKASGFPCRKLEGRSPSNVAGCVGGGSPPPCTVIHKGL